VFEPGGNGVLDTSLEGDDIVVAQSHTAGIGPNFTCDTRAVGDDIQFIGVGSGEPLLTGFDDSAAIDWRIGPSRAAPAPGAPLPPVQPHHDLALAQLYAVAAADLAHAPTVTGYPGEHRPGRADHPREMADHRLQRRADQPPGQLP
jgi:hypothetical protein